MYLTADEILGADDLKSEDVPVPEWGGTVRVQGMTGAARDKFEDSMMNDKLDGVARNKALDNYRARLAVLCMVDAEGKRLFRSDAETRRLGQKSAEALNRVVEVASRLSGLTSDDVEELTGN
ncbi:hypothetical protein [Streptomyces sp. SP17KL33]|uniref:hypothetical protein n=1 Tax=Streptomyces sp. SP17KL33 TaxID=3002534 RepID=UPI002E79A3BB|nr:hypothetical protein [Streptomyces sp. SP17KL33]MEE1835761.1 hypothetical protein [Streptomyces sp. SP17KL33]